MRHLAPAHPEAAAYSKPRKRGGGKEAFHSAPPVPEKENALTHKHRVDV